MLQQFASIGLRSCFFGAVTGEQAALLGEKHEAAAPSIGGQAQSSRDTRIFSYRMQCLEITERVIPHSVK